MIRLNNIFVKFKDKNREIIAVNDVSLHIERGEIFGIVGESGAGKSTLLRTINLLERPVEGRVIVDNEEITDFYGEGLRQARLRIGMIFQHFNLIRGKTIFDNIAFGLKASGKDKKEIESRTNELLSLVGLSDKRDSYPSQLSGGQKQRVGIARALANSPQVLLCDEPTSALDLETTESILSLLKDINKKLGITIVIITHEMNVVKSICDKVAVMKDGNLLEVQDTYSLFSSPINDFTEQLVGRTLNLELPEQIYKNAEGEILKVTYRGSNAIDPILSSTAKKYDVDLSILHGKIEYILDQPLGILILNIVGNDEEVKYAIDYIKEKTSFTEVLYAN